METTCQRKQDQAKGILWSVGLASQKRTQRSVLQNSSQIFLPILVISDIVCSNESNGIRGRKVTRKFFCVLPVIAVAMMLSPMALNAGGFAPAYGPPLDTSLMAFKEQGAWYFLCEAPTYPYRIPPHYLTYGPPPPCGPVPPCGPPLGPRPAKVR